MTVDLNDDDTAVSPAPQAHMEEQPMPLRQAWLHPARFFAASALKPSWKLQIALMAVIGLGAAIDRMQSQPALTARLTNALLSVVLPLAGAIMGALRWYLGGLWFRLRLRFCGIRRADRGQTNYVNGVSEAPAFLLNIVQALPGLALADAPYRAARTEIPVFIGFAWIMLWLWGIYMNYEAARVRFGVPKRGRVAWFVVVPVLVYFGALAVATWRG